VAQRKSKDERDVRLALIVELKTLEEMLVMKKCELKDFDANVDSDSERDFVRQQITKLQKKQRVSWPWCILVMTMKMNKA
jgi:hypothetical protein